MNSRKFTILATLTLFLISLTFLYGCGGQDNKSGTQVNSNQQQAEEQYKIRLNHGLPQEHFMALEIQEWADLVEQKSDGRLKIEMYPSAQLYKDPDLIQAVRSGVIEAGATYNFLFENLIPEFEPLVFPRIMTSTRHMHNVINGDVGNILMSRVEENDMKVLSWLYWPVETTGTISNKPIHVPSDMKGMKFRTTGGIQAVLLKKVGASSSYISGAEMYMALQRRTIDGGLQNNFAHVLDRKFYEVSPYYTITKMGQTVDLIIINKSFMIVYPLTYNKFWWIRAGKCRKKA